MIQWLCQPVVAETSLAALWPREFCRAVIIIASIDSGTEVRHNKGYLPPLQVKNMPFYDLRTAGFQEYPTQIADQNGCCPELISGLSPSSRLPSKAAISRPTAIFSGGGESWTAL